MEHEPSGFLSDTQGAVNLIARHAVLAVGDHPHSHEPAFEGNGAVLEDGADLDGELAFLVPGLALPDPALRDVGHVYAPAFGAGNAVRPATGHEVGNAVVGVLEEDDGFLESLRASIHHAIMAGENRKSMGQAKGFILLWRGGRISGILGQELTMEDALTPEWIRNRKAQTAVLRTTTEAAEQSKAVTQLRIEAEGPEFYRQVLLEIKLNLDALPDIGARGTLSTFGSPRGEQRCRIDVARAGSPSVTYTDMAYAAGDSKIRTWTLEGDARVYSLCVGPKGIRLMADDEFVQKTAREVAESLIEAMVDRVIEP